MEADVNQAVVPPLLGRQREAPRSFGFPVGVATVVVVANAVLIVAVRRVKRPLLAVVATEGHRCRPLIVQSRLVHLAVGRAVAAPGATGFGAIAGWDGAVLPCVPTVVQRSVTPVAPRTVKIAGGIAAIVVIAAQPRSEVLHGVHGVGVGRLAAPHLAFDAALRDCCRAAVRHAHGAVEAIATGRRQRQGW